MGWSSIPLWVRIREHWRLSENRSGENISGNINIICIRWSDDRLVKVEDEVAVSWTSHATKIILIQSRANAHCYWDSQGIKALRSRGKPVETCRIGRRIRIIDAVRTFHSRLFGSFQHYYSNINTMGTAFLDPCIDVEEAKVGTGSKACERPLILFFEILNLENEFITCLLLFIRTVQKAAGTSLEFRF